MASTIRIAVEGRRGGDGYWNLEGSPIEEATLKGAVILR